MQAGATVKAIIEAQPHEGGFPVQANRVRRLGIPILTSHILLKAIPNADNTGITGAVIAQCENFKPIPGTETIVEGIDAINICTGLVPDDQLLIKGNEIFGRRCFGAGDAIRIGEGTSAVLRGQQVAYEILMDMGIRFKYDDFLAVSKEYIDSQQHPLRVIEEPYRPARERMEAKALCDRLPVRFRLQPLRICLPTRGHYQIINQYGAPNRFREVHRLYGLCLSVSQTGYFRLQP